MTSLTAGLPKKERPMTRQSLTDREYRHLVARSAAGMFCARRQGGLLACNDALARILGYPTRAELLTRDARALWADPDDWERMCDALDTAEALGGLERRGRRRDGGEVPVLVCLAAVEADGEGWFEGVVVDMSERMTAEQARIKRESHRAVASLATATAHEINNPLNVIRGNLELLERSVPLEARSLRLRPAVHAVDQIAQVVRAMARLTHLRVMRLSPNLPEMLDLRGSSADEPPTSS
jgi:PAS domain S-box-containing protein